MMDDDIFEQYFNNEKLLFDAQERERVEAELRELEAAELLKTRISSLVEAGFSFDGNYLFIKETPIKYTPDHVSTLSEDDFNLLVKEGKEHVANKLKEQKRKDAELAAFKKAEEDKKALLLSRFNSRSLELIKIGFEFNTPSKLFKRSDDAHDNIPSSAIVNMEDKPWKEYLNSVVSAVEAYKAQRDLTDKLTFEAGKQLTSLGFELKDEGFQSNDLDWFIYHKQLNQFKSESEMQNWVSEIKLQHAKLTQAKADADKIKAKQDAERKEAERKAALLKGPDQAQVSEFYKQFKDFRFPDLKSDAGKAIQVRVNEALDNLKKLIISEAKNLV